MNLNLRWLDVIPALVCATLLLQPACGNESAEGEGDGETAGTDEGESGDTSNESGESGTSDSAGEQGGDGDGDTSGDGDGDGDTGIDPSEACASLCETIDMCQGEPEPGCELDCVDTVVELGDMPECQIAYFGLIECLTGLDCEGLAAFDAAEGDYPCMAEAEQTEALCGGNGECVGGFGVGRGECGGFMQCPDEPEYTIDCDELSGSCVCAADGEAFASCEDYYDLLCGEQVSLEQAFADCCGLS